MKIIAGLAALLMISVLAVPSVMADQDSGQDSVEIENKSPEINSIKVTNPTMSDDKPEAKVVVVVTDDNGRDDLNEVKMSILINGTNSPLKVATSNTYTKVYEDILADTPGGKLNENECQKVYTFTVKFPHWTPADDNYDIKIDASDRPGLSSSARSTDDTTDDYEKLEIAALSGASVGNLDFGVLSPSLTKTVTATATNRGNQKIENAPIVCSAMTMDSFNGGLGDEIPADALTVDPGNVTLNYGYPSSNGVYKEFEVSLKVPAVRAGNYQGTITVTV